MQRLRAIKLWIESIVTGLAAVFYVGMVWLGTLTVFSSIPQGGHAVATGVVWAVIFVITSAIQGPFVFRVLGAIFRGQHPAVLTAALTTPVRWEGVRVVASLWWGLQFSLLAIFAVALALQGTPNGRPDPLFILFLSLFTLIPTYTAYGFLLMAVAVWPVSPERLIAVWEWRVWVAVGLAVVGAVPIVVNAIYP